MNLIYRKISMAILFLNSIGALGAGYLFMSDSSGHSMGVSPELLQYSPFSNFFIPGLVLFVTNGIFSGFIFILMVIKFRNADNLILFQGLILTGWIFVQMLMLRMIHPLHLVLGAFGVFLIYIGSTQLKFK